MPGTECADTLQRTVPVPLPDECTKKHQRHRPGLPGGWLYSGGIRPESPVGQSGGCAGRTVQCAGRCGAAHIPVPGSDAGAAEPDQLQYAPPVSGCGAGGVRRNSPAECPQVCVCTGGQRRLLPQSGSQHRTVYRCGQAAAGGTGAVSFPFYGAADRGRAADRL